MCVSKEPEQLRGGGSGLLKHTWEGGRVSENLERIVGFFNPHEVLAIRVRFIFGPEDVVVVESGFWGWVPVFWSGLKEAKRQVTSFPRFVLGGEVPISHTQVETS